jgi:predicted TIM-barrel fold metal-dependent hydrolase
MSTHSILISTDGHCGASIQGYKPYLESRFHDEFDAWADGYSDVWGEIDDAFAADDPEAKIGVSSFMSPVNWDSAARQALLDAQGVAAEVLFPNTVPPFQPSGAITTPAPTGADDYEYRLAGAQAYNRWLADFCAEEPGRRAGVAQIFLNDVDDAVREIRWAKDHGLMGVLLPADHFYKLHQLYYPEYDPVWETCVELEMPVHRHGVVPSEAASETAGMGASAVGLFEAMYFTCRCIGHLVLGGVFERYPDLRLIMVESGSAWLTSYMANLDMLEAMTAMPGTVTNIFGAPAFEQLTMKPSDYVKRNLWVGSFFTEPDIASRHDFNVEHLMWGADFPHHEGTSPDTTKALRANFASLPDDEVRAMLWENAGRCYPFDLTHLQRVADRIGAPTMDNIREPLPRADYPRWPEDTACPTFAAAEDVAANNPGAAT